MSHRRPAHQNLTSTRVAGPALVLVALASACSPLRYPELDAGADAGAEVLRDAEPAIDAHSDAAVPDAEPASDGMTGDAGSTVTVLFESLGTRIAGVPIMIHGPDSRFIELRVTGSDGTTSTEYLPGRLVTAVMSSEGSHTLATVAMSRPGQTIRFQPNLPQGSSVGDVRVRLLSGVPGATSYRIDFGCVRVDTATTSEEPRVTIGQACLGRNGDATALASARDATGKIIAYSWSDPVTPSRTNVEDVTIDYWTPPVRGCRVEISGIPAGLSTLGVACDPVRGGVAHSVPDVSVAAVAGTSTTVDIEGPSMASDARVVVGARIEPSLLDNEIIIARLVSPNASGVHTVDASRFLPPLADSSGRWVAGRLELLWNASGPMPLEVDALLMHVRWQAPAAEVHWMFELPPDTVAPFVVPDLPAAFEQIRPAAEILPEQPAVIFVDAGSASRFSDYAELYGGLWMITPLRIPPAPEIRESGLVLRTPLRDPY